LELQLVVTHQQQLPTQQVLQVELQYLHTQLLHLLAVKQDLAQVQLQFQDLQMELLIHLRLQQLMLMEHLLHLLHLTQLLLPTLPLQLLNT
jgi:hypothetical protein